MDERKLSFEDHARLDSEERRLHQPPDPLVEIVAATAPDVVVDWGAGTGYFALPIARRLPGAEVVCLDTEPRMLEIIEQRAAEEGLAAQVRTMPIVAGVSLPLAGGSADLVLMVNLYHELEDRPAALGEAVRVRRLHGRLLVCDWDPDGTVERGPALKHRVRAATAEAELRSAGFSRVKEHWVYADHWVLEATG